MNKSSYYKYFGIQVPFKTSRSVVEVDSVEVADASKSILQIIYALDPVTKLPTGDIMCYLASSTPPEIKKYIMDNLMSDTSSARMPSLPDGLDEDTVFQLERRVENGQFESLSSYRERINAYMQKQVEVRNMAIENAKREQSTSDKLEE